MAGASAAVAAAVSKFAALQEDGNRYKLSRPVRQDIATIISELQSTHDVVAKTTVAEDQLDLHKARPCSSTATGGFWELADTMAVIGSLMDRLEDLVPSSAAGYLATELREACYGLENVADDLAAYLDPSRRRRGLLLFQGLTSRFVTNMTRRAVTAVCGEIRRCAAKRRENLARLMAEVRGAVPSAVPVVAAARRWPPEAASYVLASVDTQRDKVAELLLLGEAQLTVVTINGPVGMGKTTLAHEVYRAVGSHFDCRAWVSISPDHLWYSNLVDIIRQVTDDPHWDLGVGGHVRLKKKMHKSLQDKRYLIVLDNVPTLKATQIIKYLPCNSLGSRVIVTTRETYYDELEYCLHCRNHNHVYGVRPLADESAEMLFYTRIFGSRGSCPLDLVGVSGKILTECSGVPLALTLLSGLLANKPCIRMIWEQVHSFIAGCKHDFSDKGMRNIVLLCYHGLPQYLKTCLLHLSIFPKDYLIDRDRVVRSWIAEGFVLENNGRTPEEEGESYFADLVQRGFIKPARGSSYDAERDAFLVQGFVLDLIRSKVARDNFVTLLGNREPAVLKRPTQQKIYRVSITSEYHDITKLKTVFDIRSLYVFGGVLPKLPFKRLAFLRVLDLEGCQDLKYNDIVEIAGLKRLRLLSIKDTPISVLPDQIGQLQHLITLDIRGTEIRKMPMSIVQLRTLKNLLCDETGFPKWLRKMRTQS